MKILTFILICGLLQSCGTVGSLSRPQSYYEESSTQTETGILGETSLGQDDKKIKELLHYKIKLPRKNRIAILKLSSDNNWRFYSNDFTVLNDSLVDQLIKKLRGSSRVYDASFLPAMLVPEKRTVPVLREAAARFQADLLLAYRSSCNSYQKYRIFKANVTKSYCSIEAVLLDVRSGIIAKSVVSTENFSAPIKEEDTNFDETIKKAELEAVSKALGEVATEIIAYLKDVALL